VAKVALYGDVVMRFVSGSFRLRCLGSAALGRSAAADAADYGDAYFFPPFGSKVPVHVTD